jgi:cation diffusion facilitator family transporter
MQASAYLKLSVAVALATIALKTAAWQLTGSVSLLSDAMESLVNLAGAVFALLMVGIAAQPADDGHPYGHHKAEYFSSGFEGVLILAAALAIVWAAARRFFEPEPLQSLGWGLGLSIAASAMNAALAWAMLRKARELRSIALEGDARHLFTDVWTSAGVVLGLLAVAGTGWLWLDPLLAIAVACNIAREGVSLLRRSVDGLMDRSLESICTCTYPTRGAWAARRRCAARSSRRWWPRCRACTPPSSCCRWTMKPSPADPRSSDDRPGAARGPCAGGH